MGGAHKNHCRCQSGVASTRSRAGCRFTACARSGPREGLAVSAVTVIDRNNGLAPRAFDRPGTGAHDPLIKAKLMRLQAEMGRRNAQEQIEFVLREEFSGETAVVS